MKKNLFYILIVCVVSMLFLLTGCKDIPDNDHGNDDNNDTTIYYEVTFDSRGGSEIESQKIREGNPIIRPQTPIYEGYYFIGWFKQDDTEWNFSTDRVTEDITLYAGWQEETKLPESTVSLTFEKEGNAYTVTGVGEETIVVIPSTYEGLSVTKIQGHHGTGAFAQKAITSITIPDSIIEIGQNTFYGCRELVEVKLGRDSSLTTIGNNAFSACSSLKQMTIPKGVTHIGDAAFNNCSSLKSFIVDEGNTKYRSENGHLIETATQTLIRGVNNSTIPSSVKIIEVGAFRRANGITELDIPMSVEKIGNYFIADSTITKIKYAGTQAEWERIEKSSTMWNYGNRNVEVICTSSLVPPSEPEILCEIYLSFGNEIITAKLYDNATSRDLVSRLPLTLEFSDYNDTEKIAYLPSESLPLDTSDAPKSFTPDEGDMTIYAPWGNIAIFYKAFSESLGLAPFGKITSEDIEKLSAISDKTQITFAKEKPTEPEQPTEEPKILVVYFSATNTTKTIANYIQSYLDADMFEIIPVVPYTSADLNYGDSSSRTSQENRDDACRPEIVGRVEDIDQYDVIFIGYPIWHGKAPKVIYTFLEQYDLSGKTIIPFCTAASSGIGSSATYLENLTTEATWLNGIRFLATASQSSVQTWINSVLPNQKDQ
ncbi:MAG: leucine-rich repeat protein [Anaeroplasmataceae bacterium]|nr:leucine-rich repeat protein [Anaeroplasmataceae bacterium]